jgi:hypothetical protein
MSSQQGRNAPCRRWEGRFLLSGNLELESGAEVREQSLDAAFYRGFHLTRPSRPKRDLSWDVSLRRQTTFSSLISCKVDWHTITLGYKIFTWLRNSHLRESKRFQ